MTSYEQPLGAIAVRFVLLPKKANSNKTAPMSVTIGSVMRETHQWSFYSEKRFKCRQFLIDSFVLC